MRNELRNEIAAEESEVEDFHQSQADELVSQHNADLGSDVFFEERALSTKKALESELAAVERALAHIHQGTYGTCERCGQPIATERLQARPQAIRCTDCERRRD